MQPPPSPSMSSSIPLGMMGVESITEGIQNCHVSMEESRRRLMPLVSLLDDDDGHDAKGTRSTYAVNHQNYTDSLVVQEFLHCIEGTVASVEKLVVSLADSGLVSSLSNENKNDQRSNISNGVQVDGESDVYLLMASNCIHRACEFVASHFMKLVEADSLESSSGGPLDDSPESGSHDEHDSKIQPCIGRLAELTLRLIHMQSSVIPASLTRRQAPAIPNSKDDEGDQETSSPWEIIDAYAQYQRRCLRTRAKPSITSLAELRRVATNQNCFVSDIVEQERVRQQLESGMHINDEHEGEEVGLAAGGGGGGGNVSRGQPHAQSVTVILGEASSLIQPLAAWRDALPLQTSCEEHDLNDGNLESWLRKLCENAMDTLDSEAETLAVTVGSWFAGDQRGLSSLEQSPGHGYSPESLDLVSMEAALEEMAFLCQVLSRYCLFSRSIIIRERRRASDSKDGSKLHNLLTEQSLHYSTLETRLAALQFNQALSIASPQLIELGRPSLQVPSIVEDAHFVCVRAIERAAGTRSERAVWTVGHWVCEIWGLEQNGVRGVYRALVEGVGCSGGHSVSLSGKTGPASDPVGSEPSKTGSSFAASLLEAVDDDIGTNEKAQDGSNPPLSGGVQWGRGSKSSKDQSLQSKVDAELCALNGFLAAQNACLALSGLFADLVDERLEGDDIGNKDNDKKSSMLTFARDELASHSRSYHKRLQERVHALVFDLCGADDLFDCEGHLCLQNLRLFIEREVYNLDSYSFRSMESDDRLDAEMIGPIRRSQIFDEIRKDKCDSAVVLLVAEAMSWKSAEIIFQVLLMEQKEFNDWGAMLLSKQVRALQNVYCGLVLGGDVSSCKNDTENGALPATVKQSGLSAINTANILKQFERVNQAVSLLQLEKPSDWLAFDYKVGEGDDSNLTADEIRRIMSLRLDFSEEAITKVCSQIKSK
ncbi:hypothetical protein HJC23_000727 [Cyclotella cryptica]|uniref:Uncharacterized protein n=1 Tax=Cyclotella cryptica TaxID=29204 RepID=A0ABD3Q9E4_9STRA|eukprot:CCRYP_007427-RA/>CCRYP_007427-RA protein AED:0.02 eAED:0.02 QI:108/1/1/1/0.5/0.33/3/804/937